MRILFALAVMVGPAATSVFASTCAEVPDYSDELSALFEEARAAETYQEGRTLSGRMWEVWLRAPDEAAQAVLDRGLSRRDSYDYVNAYADFTRLIEYCPDYAEGWNQRAFISFLRDDLDQALVDLDKALALQPRHVAAQAGRGLTLLKLGRIDEARTQMLAAVANNPWLNERALLEKGAPLGPKGEDI
ncbi:hypothetical protein K3756_05770 [Sulfitobacter sp. S190]|nr:hypothetical protein K3756_05770 [Sulfitobacter sp. S190]